MNSSKHQIIYSYDRNNRISQLILHQITFFRVWNGRSESITNPYLQSDIT